MTEKTDILLGAYSIAEDGTRKQIARHTTHIRGAAEIVVRVSAPNGQVASIDVRVDADGSISIVDGGRQDV